MHILQTLQAKKRDGIGEVVQGYTRGLVALGAKVTVITDLPAKLRDLHAQCGAKVFYDPAISMVWQAVNPLAVWRNRRLIRQNGITAIIVHNGKAFWLMRLAAPAHIPVISVCHLDNFTLRLQADAIVCVNKDQVGRVRNRMGPGKAQRPVCVIPNPHMVDDMPPLTGDDIRIAGWRGRGRLVIGAMGRMEPEKGMDILIEAARRLIAAGWPVTVRIAGEGRLRPGLAAQAAASGVADHIDLCGWVEDRHDFFRSLDVFVSASRSEPYGLVIAEAAHYGVPLVATATPGALMQLQDGATGRLAPVAEPQALADAIAACALDTEQTLAMALSARDTQDRRLPTQDAAQRLIALVHELTNG